MPTRPERVRRIVSQQWAREGEGGVGEVTMPLKVSGAAIINDPKMTKAELQSALAAAAQTDKKTAGVLESIRFRGRIGFRGVTRARVNLRE
jgi:hypothetical protein